MAINTENTIRFNPANYTFEEGEHREKSVIGISFPRNYYYGINKLKTKCRSFIPLQ